MSDPHESSIAKLVKHNGGPTQLSRLLGGSPAYQEIQRWVYRNWASPMYLLRLEPFMPKGMTLADLDADRSIYKASNEAA